MLDELHERIKTYLEQHRQGVITTSGTLGAWAAPFWQYSQGLELIGLLPPWSDVLYHIEQDPQVQVVILDPQATGLRWLQIRGSARRIDLPDWIEFRPIGLANRQPETRYTAVRIVPQRIDLFDENLGWGARETVEF